MEAVLNDKNLKPAFIKGVSLFMKILRDWFSTLLCLPLRSIVISEVRKVLNCRNPKNGVMYCCDHCDEMRFVPFTCKSRFCPSCGNLYNMQRANSMAERLFDVPHRHVIFTIPDTLRPFFLKDRSLLNLLFEAASETYKTVIAHGFTGKLEPGIVCVLHTFSRSSDWNPHIHCMATEGGLTKWGAWRPRPFIIYANLRRTFQDLLLKKMRRRIPNFKSIEAELREKYDEGFFVYAPPAPARFGGNLKQLVKYLARYLGRPCIGTSRIDSYNGKTVSFHYMAHVEDREEYKSETIHAKDFLLRLFQHIQEPNFVMVRYYGIYAPSEQASDTVMKALEKGNLKFLYSVTNRKARAHFCHWRGAMQRAFHVDPLSCPCCQREMQPVYYIMNGRTVWDPPVRHNKRRKSSVHALNWGYNDE